MKNYHKKLNYVGNSKISYDPDYVYCTFDDVASIVAEGIAAETALDNLRNVYEKYQTGEYNYLSVDVVSKMTYSEYCRVIEGTLTDEDIFKFGTSFRIEYPRLPPLYSLELSLSDGTVFEFCTRVELSETLKARLAEFIVKTEVKYTDKNGILDAESCIKEIKACEYMYAFDALYGK